jgi:glycosidase
MWFKEAKKDRDNQYRDFYIWKKPKYDEDGNPQPPNNWEAAWGGMISVFLRLNLLANKVI